MKKPAFALLMCAFLVGCRGAAPDVTGDQIGAARKMFCAARASFNADAAQLAPCSFNSETGDSTGDCSQRIALTGKYFGPLPDQIASALGISHQQAQQTIGRVQLEIGQGNLPACGR